MSANTENLKTPVLRFENAGFAYPGYSPVLSEFSASLYEGEIICIIGASGCGKSTMLSLAGGFLLPDSGLITDSRGTVSGPEPKRIMVFQDSAQLFPWLTVFANASFPDADPTHVSELLEMVDLADAAEKYPSQLSGGMKQRAVIARALAGRPEILLLDEPFTALDAPTRRGLQDMLLELNSELGVSMMFVTHDIREAVYLADRLLIMTPGGVKMMNIELERGAGKRDEFSNEFVAIEREVYGIISPDKS
ncbi:MAG: ABC transporter ATP-binding protein [Spirochaetales bacterium]|uniref:ABC transporter ATP-binding protein n=1 Tax=Candidatus Thalassospirochaeta sargassi TaxID=3119039 RepID=A0AAJ1MNU0_9SPIO|nr:ABC transporter ATP-binding protein [Spirochaetales bacterium]